MSTPIEIRYGANFKIIGKADPQKLSFGGAWKTTKGTIADLAAHIGKGHPWMPALLNGNRQRWQTNANAACVLALDIDEGMTLAEAQGHPFIRQHAALIIESASSTNEHNKFRIVFILPTVLQGWENIRLCNKYLAHVVGSADPACKDASRYFFGAPGRSPVLLNESATLPDAFVDEAKAWDAAIAAEHEKRAEAERQRWEEWRSANPDSDPNELILQALDYADPDESYSDWLGIGATLKALGFPCHVWDGWSAKGSKYQSGECERKWRTFRSPEARPGHLFNLAKRGGFQFPKQSRKQVTVPTGKPQLKVVAGGNANANSEAPQAAPVDLYTLSFKPDVEVCDRHFSEDIEIPTDAKLIAIKAAKGIGKSHLASRLTPPGKKKLLLTHRDRLGRHLAIRFDVPYLEQVKIQTNEKGVGLCFDSAHPESAIGFEGKDWIDADIFIDEAEQSLWHLLNSGTISDKRRLAILKEICPLLAGALSPESKGRVFLMDADLSDLSINAVRSLGGHQSLMPFVILNTYQIQKGKAYCYSGPEEMLSKLKGEIADGGKVMVLTAGQDASSKYGAINQEKHWKKHFPEKRILRIDAETIANPEHPAYGCSDSINATLQRYDIVIITTVFESGISIDVQGYFTGVWGFFGSGHLAENTVRQFLGRLRDWEVPRHCQFPKEGNNGAFIGDRHCTDIKKLLDLQMKLGKKNVAALALSGYEVDADGSVIANAAALTAWAKFAVRLNKSFGAYGASLKAGLEAEGYQVEDVHSCLEVEELIKIQDEVTAQRDESEAEHAQAVTTRGSEPRSKEEFEELKKKRSKTDDERCAERRYQLRQTYGVDVTPEIVLRDDKGWYSFLRVQYLLSLSAKELAQEEGDRLGKQIHQKQVFIPDVNRKSVYAKVDLLKKLGMGILLDPEREFTSESPEIKLAAAIAIANSDELKMVTGLRPNPTATPLAICQDILARTVGFRLKHQQRRVNGAQVRFYSYVHCLDPGKDSKNQKLADDLNDRARVFEVWRERAIARQAERDEKSQVSHENPNRSFIDFGVTDFGVTDGEEWFAPGAIEDAQSMLDAATDAEARATVLELMPEHIRMLLGRRKPIFKAVDRPVTPKRNMEPIAS